MGIFLYYSKDETTGDPIVQIFVSDTPFETNLAPNVENVRWDNDGTPPDMNKGFITGFDIYIVFKREEN